MLPLRYRKLQTRRLSVFDKDHLCRRRCQFSLKCRVRECMKRKPVHKRKLKAYPIYCVYGDVHKFIRFPSHATNSSLPGVMSSLLCQQPSTRINQLTLPTYYLMSPISRRGITAIAIAALSSIGSAERVSMARISTTPSLRITFEIEMRL